MQIKQRISQFFKREDGASALEYVIMAAMVAVFISVTFSAGLQTALTNIFTQINTAMTVK